MKNYLSKAGVMLASLLFALQVNAASLIDFTDTAVTTAATDITDTGTAASAFVIPIIIGVIALTVGIKLFKRFANKI